MKRILMAIMAVTVAVMFSAPAFAEGDKKAEEKKKEAPKALVYEEKKDDKKKEEGKK